MKRIVILNRMYPAPGGRNTFIQNLKEGLKDQYEFLVISSKGHNSDGAFYSWRLINYFVSSFFKLVFLNKKPTIILGVGLSSLGGVLYGKLFGVPVIFNLSDTNKRSMIVNKNKSLRSKIGVKLTIFFENLSLKMANYIAVPSETSKIALLEDYNFLDENKVLVINEGIPRRKKINGVRPKYGYSKKDKIILFPYPSKRKNIETLINLIPEISKIENVKIIILGNEDQLDDKQIKIVEEFKSKITFSGKINEIKKRELFSIANILVYIPKNESHSYTVLEALNYKVPLILSNVGWLKETLPEYTLQDSDVKILKNKIEKLVSFKKSVRIERVIKAYDYYEMLKKYKELFSRCLKA